MPDEFEAEAAARKVREDLEHELYKARERVQRAENRVEETRGPGEEARLRAQQNPDELIDGVMAYMLGAAPVPPPPTDPQSGGAGPLLPPLPPPSPAEQAAKGAVDELAAARAEAARIERRIADLPPTESILDEIDSDPILGGSGSKPLRPTRRRGGSISRAAGAVLAGAGGFLLFQSFGGPGSSPATQPGGAGAVPSASPSASPSTSPSASPIAVVPATGSSLALVDFTRTSGSCPFAAEFQAGFRVAAVDGAFTLTQQVGTDEHVSDGTIDAVTGAFNAMAPGQSYEGIINGTSFRATYTDTTGNCNDVYDVDGDLTRPLFGDFNTVPGRFEFFDPRTNLGGFGLLDIAAGQPVHVIVGSTGTPDMTTQLPIRVVGSSGDDTFWDFTIDGDPSAVCRDATGCSADAPTPRLAAWDNEAVPLLIVATGSGDDVIAVHAPHGVPAAVAPSTPPSAAPSARPSAAPSATASAVPATPSSSGGGPNVPLAGLGLVLILTGLTLFAAPQLVGGPAGAKPAPRPSPGGVTPDEAKALGDLLDNRPPPTQTPSPSDIAAGYEGTPSGVTPDDAKALGDLLDNRPPPTATPPTPAPSPGGVTPDEAKALGDLLDNRPPPPPPAPGTTPPPAPGTSSGGGPPGGAPQPDVPKRPPTPR